MLPVQFGQVGPDLDRVIVVPHQRDRLKLRLFILAGLFQDTGQTIMQRYQSAHAEWLSFLLLCNPFFKLHRHPLEVVIGRIIGIGCSHRHSGSGERPFVRYPLYPAGAGGFWISTLERHAGVLAGIARARDQGTQLGRRRLEDTDSKKVAAIRSARKKGVGVRRIARDLGVGVGTVLRLTAEA